MKAVIVWLTLFLCAVTGYGLDSAKLNKVLGLELFGKDGWQEEPRSIERRLRIRLETTMVKGSPQYAGYPFGSCPCLGVDLTYLTIKCSETGEISSVILMLTNKGDFGEDKSDFKRRFKADARVVTRALEGAFGKTKKHKDVSIWTVGDAVISFANVKDEYLSVEISRQGTSSRKPDNKQRLKDRKEIKHADYSDNLERTSFGDCYIRNVPMIDQGDKGYCGPATVERSLLYYGVTAFDMHELAEMFETKNGGGTSWKTLVSESRRIFPKYGISVKSRHLKLKTVKDAIDKGNLIIWVFDYNDTTDSRLEDNTAMRSSYAPDKWRAVIAKQKRLKKSNTRAGHVDLIVGYNEQTGEIALSDSWSNLSKMRWIPCEDAERICYDQVLVLEP